jgi:murein DD-endopeptidase MepM/ murein hydrolase activator NlpD
VKTRKYLTLMIIPHEHGGVRSVRVPYAWLKAALGLTFLAALGGVLFFVAYGRLALTAAEAERLEHENTRLNAMRGKVEDLARNLEQSEHAYRQIREMAGIRAPVAVEAGKVGTGDGALTGQSPSNPRPLEAEERTLLTRTINTVPRQWPLTKNGFVSEEFNPLTGHTGIDIAVQTNTPVLASADGIVVGAGVDSIYGKFVLVQHDATTLSLYGHNSLNFVSDGELVRQGDIIAQSGNSGRSSAPHLHFEVRKNGTAVDPRRYLQR